VAARFDYDYNEKEIAQVRSAAENSPGKRASCM